MLYKVTYYEDPAYTIVKEKLEESPLTAQELLGHAHVIAVEEVKEEEEVKTGEKAVKETKKKKK